LLRRRIDPAMLLRGSAMTMLNYIGLAAVPLLIGGYVVALIWSTRPDRRRDGRA